MHKLIVKVVNTVRISGMSKYLKICFPATCILRQNEQYQQNLTIEFLIACCITKSVYNVSVYKAVCLINLHKTEQNSKRTALCLK